MNCSAKSEALNNGFITSVLSLNEPQDKDKIDGVDYIQADIVNNIQLKEKLSTHRFDYIVYLSGYIDLSDFFDGGEHIINTHFLGLVNLLQIIDPYFIFNLRKEVDRVRKLV